MPIPPPTGPPSPKSIIEELHSTCTIALSASLTGESEPMVGQSYLLVTDLQAWCSILHRYPEVALLQTANSEYLISLLNVCQGQYRNAFKGLRLVLELCLQSTHISANLVLRGEWLKGERDTIWAALVDDKDGPLSRRYCKAFFPDVCDHVAHFRVIAQTVYSELSECIHGNVPTQIPLPASLEFNPQAMSMWHEKAKIVRLVIVFALAERYLLGLSEDERSVIELGVSDQLGHIQEIRSALGGVVG